VKVEVQKSEIAWAASSTTPPTGATNPSRKCRVSDTSGTYTLIRNHKLS
jgi:hypothetical protein